MDFDQQLEIARCLFRESSDALFVFDPRDRCVVDINPAALRLSGLTRKAVLGLRVHDLFTAARPEDLRRLMEAFVRTGQLHSSEDYRLVRRAGEPLPVNVSVCRIHTKPQPLGLVVARDVSERRKAQEDLDRFFELSPALFSILDRDGRFLKFNSAWEQTLGYSVEELRSVRAVDLIHPDDREATRAAGEALLRGELPDFVNRYRHRDGSTRWLSWRVATVGDLIYAVAMDVTERQRALELQQAKEAAELASRSKDRFLAVLSHELRTPLTPVLMAVSALLDDDALAPSLRPTLEMIYRNVTMEARLIDDLLDLSRIGRGGLRLELRPIDAHESVRKAVEIYQGVLTGEGLELVLDLSAPAHHMRADPARLQQMVWNLIQNAVKFTPPGGTISVRSRNVNGPEGENPRLVIEVSDTGIGFAPEILPRLFEAFEQGEDAIRRRSEGLGLGLAISRSLAEAHGGSLTAFSPGPGKGSTFTLELPVISQPGSAPPSPAAVAAPVRQLRILLVEDNQDTLRHLALVLGLRGHEVRTADRLSAALDAASTHRFDLLISDIELPDGSGLELLRKLDAPSFPAIAMSGYGSDDDIRESLAAGYREHLTKPIDLRRLTEAIQRATARGE